RRLPRDVEAEVVLRHREHVAVHEPIVQHLAIGRVGVGVEVEVVGLVDQAGDRSEPPVREGHPHASCDTQKSFEVHTPAVSLSGPMLSPGDCSSQSTPRPRPPFTPRVTHPFTSRSRSTFQSPRNRSEYALSEESPWTRSEFTDSTYACCSEYSRPTFA